MVFNETEAESEVVGEVDEEVLIRLYCTLSDYVKMCVSACVIGLVLFLLVGFCVWSRNQRYKDRLSHAEEEEGGKEKIDSDAM